MPVELGIWRIDGGVRPIEFKPMDLESRLEEVLEHDIGVASPNWMVIGRQVPTAHGSFIDLLAIDRDGNLVVVELKRDKTPRDIIAQTLDYGSWVRTLRDEDIAKIFDAYQRACHPERTNASINEAFHKRFGVHEMPDELNANHELVIVASALDSATERIVTYLAEQHQVRINAIFFRFFRDGDREYLSRAWLNDPALVDSATPNQSVSQTEWNGEFYVSFGADDNRDWEEARKYGFISGGGGSWYSRTLELLEPGARVWVNKPGVGYIGVGGVVEAAVPVDEFVVKNDAGKTVPIVSVAPKASKLNRAADGKEIAEHLVRIKWTKTVPVTEAVKERGFFGNQNTVAQPKVAKWQHTVERLKKRWNIN